MNPTGEWPYPSGLPGWPGGENGNGMVSRFFLLRCPLFPRVSAADDYSWSFDDSNDGALFLLLVIFMLLLLFISMA